MMDNKEELRKIYNNIMKLPTKNYFQAKIILCLSK